MDLCEKRIIKQDCAVNPHALRAQGRLRTAPYRNMNTAMWQPKLTVRVHHRVLKLLQTIAEMSVEGKDPPAN